MTSNSLKSYTRLPAEWEPQDAVLLTWPHGDTDWAPILAVVERVYLALVQAIVLHEAVVIVVADEALKERLLGLFSKLSIPLDRIHFTVFCPDDSWARDHGPITVQTEKGWVLKDFTFNGWGGKFEAARDNQITRALHRAGAFDAQVNIDTLNLVLEGGAIESDGKGLLLTTEICLLNPNRNPTLSREAIEAQLRTELGVQHFYWLKSGYLAGDDTDSHIDTLARLAPNDTILYVKCDDPKDEHFKALSAMESELKAFVTPDGRPFNLIPLPWPKAVFDEEGHRMPATYANFLILNNVVLVPVYGDVSDPYALEQVALAFPERSIVGIDCLALIRQHGSLHCVTMQIPAGVLAGTTKPILR
jgi:agmatine deiminase